MKLISTFFSPKIKKDCLFIFIGDMGTNVLNKLYKNNKGDFYFLAINTDASHLKNNVNIPDENKLFIGDKTEHSCGERDFESGLNYVKQNRKRIQKSIRKFRAKKIVLIAGLRYSSASGVIAGISDLVNRSKTTAIVSTPFTAEGQNAFINSSKALIALDKNVHEVISFSCEDLMRENGGKLLIRDLDKKFEDLTKSIV